MRAFLSAMMMSLIAVSTAHGEASSSDVRIKWLKRTPRHSQMRAQTESQILQRLSSEATTKLSLNEAREIRVIPLPSKNGERLLEVQVLSAKYHRMERFHARQAADGHITSLSAATEAPATETLSAKCPDFSAQFLAFAPNQDELEQSTTEEVAKAAEAAGLKVVRLLKSDATRANYLNYMACPNLKGNFYDGDADPTAIVTVDGVLTSDDFASSLPNAFRLSVTNIWLACQAYNNPMRDTQLDVTRSQKYAAGINNLLVGPSDRAGACTMERALQGLPMEASFTSCYSKFDVKADKWGFGGQGRDYFGD